jgi:hypothetical protein
MNEGLRFKLPLVINRTHGGFHLTDALVEELRKRDWEHLSLVTRVHADHWYLDHAHQGQLRRDPVLIDVVRKFEAEVAELSEAKSSWKDVAALEWVLLCGLRAVEVTVELEISDHAGLETVRVIGGLW